MKTKKSEIHGFTSRIDACCGRNEYRAALERIHFRNGFAYATNAHVLVKIPLSRYGFCNEAIEYLNGHSISRKQFTLIYNKNITILPGEICLPDFFTIKLKPADEQESRLVTNIEAVIPNEFNPVAEIGINVKLMMQAYLALGCKYSAKIKFVAANKVMLLKCNEGDAPGIAVIMPTMINE